MRLVHMTDVHFYSPPRLRGVFGKRALGLANLYVVGRVNYFDASRIVAQAVHDALSFEPDAFVMTGDLTAMASQAEFELARRTFAPLLDSVPSVVVPGNHDAYTRGSVREARMERHFAEFMSGGRWDATAHRWSDGADLSPGEPVPWPVRFSVGDLDIVATNPCRPTLRSTGQYDDGAIQRAEALVRESREAGRQVVYLMHYPPLWRDGTAYDREGHRLEDVDDVLASFRRAPPHLVLHGHKHECWRTSMTADGGDSINVLNCGSTSAVSPLPDRTAGYWIIELKDGRIVDLRRRILLPDADAFGDHPGSFGAD